MASNPRSIHVVSGALRIQRLGQKQRYDSKAAGLAETWVKRSRQLRSIAEFGSPETGPQRGAKLGPPSQLAQAPLRLRSAPLRPAQVKAAAAQVHARQWKLLRATFGKRIRLFLLTTSKQPQTDKNQVIQPTAGRPILL